MVRTLKWLELPATGAAWQGRLAVTLIAVGHLLLTWAARLQRVPAGREPPQLEVARLDIGGQRGAAVYEGGRLVAWLPGVDRL